MSLNGYLTVDKDVSFCERVFKVGERNTILLKTENPHILLNQKTRSNGLYNFLRFHNCD
jgi:hypothetical protein